MNVLEERCTDDVRVGAGSPSACVAPTCVPAADDDEDRPVWIAAAITDALVLVRRLNVVVARVIDRTTDPS